MRGPSDHSTNLPEPSGPTDDRFVYHLTPAGQQLLAQREEATGTHLHRPAARAAEVADAVHRETTRRRRKALAESARRNGRRFGTISYRQRQQQQFPALRVSGLWLREAGFDLGQEFEIIVDEGRLVIEAL
jgi:hypothetical protein